MRALSRCVHVWLVLFLSVLVRPGIAQTNFTTVVVFGDSLSDTGNIAHLTQQQYGIRFPADNQLLGMNYTDGRFTDGTDTQPAASKAYSGVWVEQFAGLLGTSVAVKNSLDGGTNYAYGDATTGNGTTTETKTYLGVPLSITLNNMGQQVTDYLATNPKPNAQTLYVLWGGGNDLLNAAEAGQDPVAAAQTAAMNELALVQTLMAAGATNFVIPNLPPLGAFAGSAPATAVAALNTASGVFAQALTIGTNTLNQSALGATLHIYQPDIFTFFQQLAAAPMSYGLGNLSNAAQGVSGSPDTYLIWDGLHPTTTGHHFVAATAANLLSPLSTSTTALTVPSGAVAGQAVTVSAKVSSAKSGDVPTGLVTIFDGTAAVGSGALDEFGAAQVTFTPGEAAGSSASLTAVYVGDVVNQPSTSTAATLALLSASVGTTTTLTSSTTSAGVGTPIVFTATVTPAVTTYGSVPGTVTFLEGSTNLGQGTLTNGVATLSISSLAVGTHQITATYAAGGVFGGSTSSVLSQVVANPSFTPAATPTTLTINKGASGTVTLSAASVGGFTGSVTLSCGALPAHMACSFSSPTLAVTADGTTAATDTLTLTTNGASTSAALQAPGRLGASQVRAISFASLLLPGSLALLCIGRRRRGARWIRLALALFCCVLAGGLSGCGSSTDVAAGSYTVPVIFTPAASSGSTVTAQTVSLTVTVQ